MTPLDRLGDSPVFGYTLLELLGLAGWDVAVTTPFAGMTLDEKREPGVLVIVARDGHEVRRTGESVAAVACDVFQAAARIQLQLPTLDPERSAA